MPSSIKRLDGMNKVCETAAPAKRGTETTEKLRIGVVGLGLAGAGMIPAVLAHPNCVLAGAADRSEILRSRFSDEFDRPAEEDIKSLARREDIDAIYIATPHQFHMEHTVLAADHGKHVIVEKPMALSLSDCDAMIAAAEHNDVSLIVGHTHGFDPAVALMREIIGRGQLGRLGMIAMWNYTNFLYRPRRAEELDSRAGGGILFNQVPHQVDIARTLANDEIRSVRATASILDKTRPTEGCCSAFIEFESGVSANLVYSGYDRFDSDELHAWVGENGQPKSPDYGSARRALKQFRAREDEIVSRIKDYGFGGAKRRRKADGETWRQPHFGVLIATCEGGDLRTSPDGVFLYDDDGVQEIALPTSEGLSGRREVLDELWRSVTNADGVVHNGQFGRATLEACLAIKRSSDERREIVLGDTHRQVEGRAGSR